MIICIFPEASGYLVPNILSDLIRIASYGLFGGKTCSSILPMINFHQIYFLAASHEPTRRNTVRGCHKGKGHHFSRGPGKNRKKREFSKTSGGILSTGCVGYPIAEVMSFFCVRWSALCSDAAASATVRTPPCECRIDSLEWPCQELWKV